MQGTRRVEALRPRSRAPPHHAGLNRENGIVWPIVWPGAGKGLGVGLKGLQAEAAGLDALLIMLCCSCFVDYAQLSRRCQALGYLTVKDVHAGSVKHVHARA